MNILRQYSLAFILLLALSFNADAQKREKDEEFDKEPSRIGFGVNIGNIRFFNSSFEFGLAPNVAYRVSDAFAVGFMLKADYFYKKYRDQAVKFSAFDFGPTVFARVKPLWSWENATPFLQGLFIQAEYEKGYLKRSYEDQFGRAVLDINGEIDIVNKQEDFLYLGLGASTGYPFSTFVSLHYNVLDDFDSNRLPFSYRIGFTYNY